MDLKHNSVVHKYIPHAREVTSVQLMHKRGVMLTSALDYTVKLWRVWVDEEEEK